MSDVATALITMTQRRLELAGAIPSHVARLTSSPRVTGLIAALFDERAHAALDLETERDLDTLMASIVVVLAIADDRTIGAFNDAVLARAS